MSDLLMVSPIKPALTYGAYTDFKAIIFIVFSIGCFEVENKVVKKRILNDPVMYPEKFSERARSICEGLLVKEVDQRLGFKNGSCDELRAHPFFNDINWRKLDAGLLQTETHVVSADSKGVQLLHMSSMWLNKDPSDIIWQHLTTYFLFD